MYQYEEDELVKLIALVEQLNVEQPITWLKIRFGSGDYWILSKEEPKSKSVAGSEVKIRGEIAPGWWLWTY